MTLSHGINFLCKMSTCIVSCRHAKCMHIELTEPQFLLTILLCNHIYFYIGNQFYHWAHNLSSHSIVTTLTLRVWALENHLGPALRPISQAPDFKQAHTAGHSRVQSTTECLSVPMHRLLYRYNVGIYFVTVAMACWIWLCQMGKSKTRKKIMRNEHVFPPEFRNQIRHYGMPCILLRD